MRQLAEGLAPDTPGSGGSEGWEWAPRVIAAWWRPGPVLHVRVSGAAGSPAAPTQVALWVDGWLVAQEGIASADTGATAGTSDLQIGPELWTGLTQR